MVTPLYHNGLIKLDHQFTYAGRPWNIIRWLQSVDDTVGPFSTTELNSIALATQTAFSPIHAFTRTDNLFEGVEATDFTNNTGLVGSALAGGGGTETSDGLPIHVACCIPLQITRHYRGGHPKMYLSGMSVGQLDSVDQWLSSFLTGLGSALVTWLTAMDSITITRGSTVITFKMVNLSRFSGHAERPSAVIDDIVGATVQSIVSAQRRRRGRA